MNTINVGTKIKFHSTEREFDIVTDIKLYNGGQYITVQLNNGLYVDLEWLKETVVGGKAEIIR